MAEGTTLTAVLDQMDERAEGDRLALGDVVDGLGARGYGPLLLAVALIDLLPTGGVPGIPTLVAMLVVLFAAQLIMGRDSPWLPEKLRGKSFERRKFEAARDKVKPVTRKIDALLKPRLQSLVSPIAARVVGFICIIMALTMPPLEVIPLAGAGYISALVIALMGLGLTGRDGLVVLVGGALALVGVSAAIWLIF